MLWGAKKIEDASLPMHPLLERKTRLKLATLSLEGWCSINWATSAFCGQGQIRTAEAVRQQIYSLPVLTTYLPTHAYLAMQS